ncbi:MAG: hypothetical protein HYR75_01015 [Gemmatimonadetes bacterium]|nr:hypothetical protein [Gemmatimonadota bacterium]MBI3568384.1 hypothetical protein [Gemmatimonadota bacterium]
MTSRATGPRAIVAAHGDFAAGLISAVQMITGQGAAFRAVSQVGLDAASLEVVMREAVVSHGATVVFTDLPAGSCTIAARKATRDLPDVAVVTGANLPMLLDFVMKDGAGREGAERAAAKGRDAITVAPAVQA